MKSRWNDNGVLSVFNYVQHFRKFLCHLLAVELNILLIWRQMKLAPRMKYVLIPYTTEHKIQLLIKTKALTVRKTARRRNQYNRVPHLSQDTKWESNKITINITNESQEISPFPSGDHKTAMNRRESMTNTRHR